MRTLASAIYNSWREWANSLETFRISRNSVRYPSNQKLDREDLVGSIDVDAEFSLADCSLEMFDQDGQQQALMFGERHNGEHEQQAWRDLVAGLEADFALNEKLAV